ncbi:MAG: aspartate dehydrogenase [Lachnospiraceae bacterium]|nr:aspartate dehydrogenase [Lachnospiraceae bacterium]
MFKKKAQIQRASYDKENQIPIMKCSICNGERVVGFKDIHTGKFEEVMFIRNDRDLEVFKAKYGVETIGKEY